MLLLGFLLFCKIISSNANNANIENDVYKSNEEIVGQNLIVGVSGYELTSNVKRILKKIKPAGIIFYYRNFKNEEQFANLITEVKNIVGQNCFLMIDEEPNGAERLGVFNKSFISGMPDWDNITNGADKLSELGLNVDLAPIADFPFNKNTFIRKRVPIKDIENLKSFNESFIIVLHNNGIMATLKHFPGMGFFNDDPHLKIPEKIITEDDFKQSLALFKSGIDGGADFVMTAHALYENIDTENIATFSSVIVKDLLIGELGFSGLVITDDLSDMPVTDLNNTHSVVGIKALKAGHHLITFSHQLERTEIIFDEILEESKNNKELYKIMEDNYYKTIKFKEDRKIF